jgi:hypothetical protein
MYRSGDPNTYSYTGASGAILGATSSTALDDTQTFANYTVVVGTTTWTNSVAYDAGPQPYTNKGATGASLTPLPSGNTSSKQVRINGVYAVYATTNTIETLTKQSLTTMTSTIQVSMVTEYTGSPKQTIDIPAAWDNITSIEFWNTNNSTWEALTGAFTTTSIPANSPSPTYTVDYTRYVHNGTTIGARQLRFIP